MEKMEYSLKLMVKDGAFSLDFVVLKGLLVEENIPRISLEGVISLCESMGVDFYDILAEAEQARIVPIEAESMN